MEDIMQGKLDLLLKKYSVDEIKEILTALGDEEKYGFILRAKGIVEGKDGKWIHYDYVPEEPDVREGSSAVIGKICVIGSKINEDALAALFGLAGEGDLSYEHYSRISFHGIS